MTTPGVPPLSIDSKEEVPRDFTVKGKASKVNSRKATGMGRNKTRNVENVGCESTGKTCEEQDLVTVDMCSEEIPPLVTIHMI